MGSITRSTGQGFPSYTWTALTVRPREHCSTQIPQDSHLKCEPWFSSMQQATLSLYSSCRLHSIWSSHMWRLRFHLVSASSGLSERKCRTYAHHSARCCFSQLSIPKEPWPSCCKQVSRSPTKPSPLTRSPRRKR